jgi:hypothetical protein
MVVTMRSKGLGVNEWGEEVGRMSAAFLHSS